MENKKSVFNIPCQVPTASPKKRIVALLLTAFTGGAFLSGCAPSAVSSSYPSLLLEQIQFAMQQVEPKWYYNGDINLLIQQALNYPMNGVRETYTLLETAEGIRLYRDEKGSLVFFSGDQALSLQEPIPNQVVHFPVGSHTYEVEGLRKPLYLRVNPTTDTPNSEALPAIYHGDVQIGAGETAIRKIGDTYYVNMMVLAEYLGLNYQMSATMEDTDKTPYANAIQFTIGLDAITYKFLPNTSAVLLSSPLLPQFPLQQESPLLFQPCGEQKSLYENGCLWAPVCSLTHLFGIQYQIEGDRLTLEQGALLPQHITLNSLYYFGTQSLSNMEIESLYQQAQKKLEEAKKEPVIKGDNNGGKSENPAEGVVDNTPTTKPSGGDQFIPGKTTEGNPFDNPDVWGGKYEGSANSDGTLGRP